MAMRDRCLERLHIPGSSHIAMQLLYLSPKTTCYERPYFYGPLSFTGRGGGGFCGIDAGFVGVFVLTWKLVWWKNIDIV